MGGGNDEHEEFVAAPIGVCRGNWQVLFDNGDVFPVHNFVDHVGRIVATEHGAHGMLFCGPGQRWYFAELASEELPLMSLH